MPSNHPIRVENISLSKITSKLNIGTVNINMAADDSRKFLESGNIEGLRRRKAQSVVTKGSENGIISRYTRAWYSRRGLKMYTSP